MSLLPSPRPGARLLARCSTRLGPVPGPSPGFMSVPSQGYVAKIWVAVEELNHFKLYRNMGVYKYVYIYIRRPLPGRRPEAPFMYAHRSALRGRCRFCR